MLRVEMLICKNEKRHTDCQWEDASLLYHDDSYLELMAILELNVTKSHIAHRILKDGVPVLTIKFGNDGKLFIKEA